MSELQVIGCHPGTMPDQMALLGTSRMRLRTDSLDSIGETDSLSSVDNGSQEDLEEG